MSKQKNLIQPTNFFYNYFSVSCEILGILPSSVVVKIAQTFKNTPNPSVIPKNLYFFKKKESQELFSFSFFISCTLGVTVIEGKRSILNWRFLYNWNVIFAQNTRRQHGIEHVLLNGMHLSIGKIWPEVFLLSLLCITSANVWKIM